MRLLAWNIRQGGGTRLVGIMAAILRHDADVLILSEYRGGESAERLCMALKASGYRYVTKLVPPPQRTGVLIASRRRFVERGPVCPHVSEPWRLVDVDLGVLRLTGVYMPNLKAKLPYWQTLVSAFAARSAGDALAIGDFNTCRAYVDEPGAIDVMAHLDSMDAIGFCDLWRHRYPDGREFTWYSHRGNGFRIATMRSCRQVLRRVQASSAIRMRNGWRDCRTILCCCWICSDRDEEQCHEIRPPLLQYRSLHGPSARR